MAKTRQNDETQPPPEEIELAHTGEDALERLRSLTSAVIAVPKSEIVAQEERAKRIRGH